MKTAFLFPGQGSQSVGMGADIALAFSSAADIFDRACEVLGYDLKKLCFEGPQEKLNSTAVSQPAIFTVSAALLACMGSIESTSALKADVTAGLSLGEYTALYAAGVLSFEDALSLVQKRGTAMQAAAEASDGSMVSILGLDEDKVSELCDEAAEGGLLLGVNYNCPGQIVISGQSDYCRRAVELAEKYGAIKAIELSVAGAFHTSLMQPAAEALAEALSRSEMNDTGDVKTIANINAEYYDGAEAIRSGLIRQLVEPILWQKCIEKLISDGVEDFYEIGPGRVLTGLMRRINRKIKVTNVSDVKSLEVSATVSKAR